MREYVKYLPVGKNDVFHYVQNDVARCTRNDAMFAQSTRETISLSKVFHWKRLLAYEKMKYLPDGKNDAAAMPP